MKQTPHFEGFLLIEALLAVLVVALGLAAGIQILGTTTGHATDSRLHSEAGLIAQHKLEELRSQASLSTYGDLASGSETDVAKRYGIEENSTHFGISWHISTSNGYKTADVTVAWTDHTGQATQFQISTDIAWQDPRTAVFQRTGELPGSMLNSPSGTAASPVKNTAYIRADGDSAVVNEDGSTTVVVGTQNAQYAENTRLLVVDGAIVLALPPSDDGESAQFTRINGSLYVDASATALGAETRLSLAISDGASCVLGTASGDSTDALKVFPYTCYLGPSWYGAVNVDAGDAVQVCVGGSATISAESSVSTQITPSHTREYRGFRVVTSDGSLRATGVPGGTSYPKDGTPGSATQDFLLTSARNSCTQSLASVQQAYSQPPLTRNAGKRVCISPDDHGNDGDVCPSQWPS